LEQQEVELLAQAPDRQQPARGRSIHAFGTIRGERYRVIYVVEDEEQVVITVYPEGRA